MSFNPYKISHECSGQKINLPSFDYGRRILVVKIDGKEVRFKSKDESTWEIVEDSKPSIPELLDTYYIGGCVGEYNGIPCLITKYKIPLTMFAQYDNREGSMEIKRVLKTKDSNIISIDFQKFYNTDVYTYLLITTYSRLELSHESTIQYKLDASKYAEELDKYLNKSENKPENLKTKFKLGDKVRFIKDWYIKLSSIEKINLKGFEASVLQEFHRKDKYNIVSLDIEGKFIHDVNFSVLELIPVEFDYTQAKERFLNQEYEDIDGIVLKDSNDRLDNFIMEIQKNE